MRSIRGFALQVFHNRSSLRAAALSFLLSLILFTAVQPAHALDAISVRSDAPAIDLTGVLEFRGSDTGRIPGSTASGTDGIVRRVEVRTREVGQNWIVFALAINAVDQLVLLIVVPHWRIV